MSRLYDSVVGTMALAKPMEPPRLTMEEVDVFLGACVRPVPTDRSLLELLPEKAPPRWQCDILKMVGKAGRHTPKGRVLVPRTEWDDIAKRLEADASDLIAAAGRLSDDDRKRRSRRWGPPRRSTPGALGFHSWFGWCLAGRVGGDPDWDARRTYTSQLLAISRDQGWARTQDRRYRLGQRQMRPEFDGSFMPGWPARFQGCGEDEFDLFLLGHRARLVWATGQLRPQRP